MIYNEKIRQNGLNILCFQSKTISQFLWYRTGIFCCKSFESCAIIWKFTIIAGLRRQCIRSFVLLLFSCRHVLLLLRDGLILWLLFRDGLVLWLLFRGRFILWLLCRSGFVLWSWWFGSAVFTSEVRFLLGAFLPGSYFLPLTVRWSFFSATAKSLVTCNCVHLELKSFFLIKKCAAAAKHLVGSLKSSLANFGWKGHGSIKLQHFLLRFLQG